MVQLESRSKLQKIHHFLIIIVIIVSIMLNLALITDIIFFFIFITAWGCVLFPSCQVANIQNIKVSPKRQKMANCQNLL